MGDLTDSAGGRYRIHKLTFDELPEEICMVQKGDFQPGEKACVSAESALYRLTQAWNNKFHRFEVKFGYKTVISYFSQCQACPSNEHRNYLKQILR